MKLAPRSSGTSGNRATRVAAPIVLRAGWRAIKITPPASAERPATLTLVSSYEAPGPELLREALVRCRDLGVTHAITQALRPAEQDPFLHGGGTIVQDLHLLNHAKPVAQRWWNRSASVAKARPDETIAALDYAAFGGFWHFDTVALKDALAATQISRLRAIERDGRSVGYLIAGVTQDRGFIQRIAVDPRCVGRGYASELLVDAFGWLGRRGVSQVTINTQTDNQRARELYQRHGFVLQPDHLGVVGFSTDSL